jgi:hypothetical protein
VFIFSTPNDRRKQGGLRSTPTKIVGRDARLFQVGFRLLWKVIFELTQVIKQVGLLIAT